MSCHVMTLGDGPKKRGGGGAVGKVRVVRTPLKRLLGGGGGGVISNVGFSEDMI
jgi:hypothetical protein